MAEHCGEQVAGESVGPVRPCLVVRQLHQIFVEDPFTKQRRTAFGQIDLAGCIAPGQCLPVCRGTSAGEPAPEPLFLGPRHQRLARVHKIAGGSNRTLPCIGSVAAAETTAKPWHRADDILH